MLGALTRAFGATGSQLSGVTGGNGLNVTDRVDPNWKHAATRFAKLPNQVKQSEVIKATEYASKLQANVKQRGKLMQEYQKTVGACIEAHQQNLQHAEFMTKARVKVHEMDANHQNQTAWANDRPGAATGRTIGIRPDTRSLSVVD